MIAKVLSIGWKQISVTARDEMKRFSLSRPGAARERTIAKGCLKLRNSRPPFGGHRNSRLKLRSRRHPVSLHCVECGPIPFWRPFQNCSQN